jgi:hypothetical protein
MSKFAYEHDHGNLLDVKWRVGRTLGRTVYAMVEGQASKDDVLLGWMETKELANAVVSLHNALRRDDA